MSGLRRWAACTVAPVLVLALVAGGCSDGDGDDATGSDDSVATVEEGPATGPTAAPGATTSTSEVEVPDAPPIPPPGEATLELDGEPIEVELNRCLYDERPEIGLDVSMNPPTASEDNPAGLVLIVPGAQPGPQLVDALSAALQLEGDPSFLPLDGLLELTDDLESGTLVFEVVRGDEALLGRAAFACA